MSPPWARTRDGRLYMPYGVQPTRREVWLRVWWNLWRLPLPWKWDELNPFVLDGEGDLLPKRRGPWEDITHSIENIWKQKTR